MSLKNQNSTRALVQKRHTSDVNIRRPRHTPETRIEATHRERIRVQEIRLAYKSLQRTLKIPADGRPRYLDTLKTAITRIRFLEDKLGLRASENPPMDLFSRNLSNSSHIKNTSPLSFEVMKGLTENGKNTLQFDSTLLDYQSLPSISPTMSLDSFSGIEYLCFSQ